MKILIPFYRFMINKRVIIEMVGLLKDNGGNLCLELEDVNKVLN